MTDGTSHSRSEERGSSITEMMVVLTISAAIALPVIGMVQSASSQHWQQTETLDSQANATRSLDLMAKDIRGATFAPELSTQPALGNSLPLLVPDQVGTLVLVEWLVDTDGLTRSSGPPSGTPTPEPGWTTTAIELDPSQATFLYLDFGGVALDPSSSSEVLRSCTAAITVRLPIPESTAPGGSRSPARIRSSTISFRLNQGSQSC